MTEPGHDPAWDLDEPPPPADEPALRPRSMILNFRTFADLRAEVKAAGPAKFLIRGMWPAGEYGILSGGPKDQKTWDAIDLAVSVASGTPWLNHFPIDDVGPVLVFVGEGGDRQIVRRIEAIARAKDLDPDALRIVVCTRAPHLGDDGHMAQLAKALKLYRPRLVIIDPLYLAGRGAKLGDIYAMGALLERAQHVCQDADAALQVIHHHNRSRDATGMAKVSGAGPVEWGRVIMTVKSVSRRTDPDKATHVLTELELIGGSIADDKFRINRTIRAVDPDDLDSDLEYAVTVLPGDDDPVDQPDLAPAARKLLEALQHHDDDPVPAGKLVDHVAETYGHGLTRETVSRSLNTLLKADLVDCIEPSAVGQPKLWFVRRDPRDITRDDHNEVPA